MCDNEPTELNAKMCDNESAELNAKMCNNDSKPFSEFNNVISASLKRLTEMTSRNERDKYKKAIRDYCVGKGRPFDYDCSNMLTSDQMRLLEEVFEIVGGVYRDDEVLGIFTLMHHYIMNAILFHTGTTKISLRRLINMGSHHFYYFYISTKQSLKISEEMEPYKNEYRREQMWKKLYERLNKFQNELRLAWNHETVITMLKNTSKGDKSSLMTYGINGANIYYHDEVSRNIIKDKIKEFME